MSANNSFLSQIYRDMKRKVEHIFGIDKAIPMMYFKDIDLINELLESIKPKRCLEWGSGLSTIYFPTRLQEPYEWVAIEHFKPWFEKVAKLNKNANVKLLFRPPNIEPYTDPNGDGAYEDFKDYVDAPEGKFDYIFIDGRARKDCVKKAYDLISDEGAVVLHDANRTHYHEHLGMFKNNMLFDDHHKKYGGVWIGSKKTPLNDLFRVSDHKSVWKKHDQFAKIFKPFG